MTEAMKITLSTQPADGRWGEKATWSINNDGIALHLNGGNDSNLLIVFYVQIVPDDFVMQLHR
ncbi:hypothetical protein U2180_27690, partial [Klebsiella pneumoniae]